jgi:hypothetical protein
MAKTANNTQELIGIMKECEQKLVPMTVAMLPEYIETTVKPEVISRCPSEEEEEWLISTDTQGIGTTEGRRFLRDGSARLGMSSRQAVAMEKPIVSGKIVSFGELNALNKRTVFSWYNKTFEKVKTAEAWIFMETLEWGGTWTVVPSAGVKALNPEDGVVRSRMLKSIQPHLMFTRGSESSSAISDLIARIGEVVNRAYN